MDKTGGLSATLVPSAAYVLMKATFFYGGLLTGPGGAYPQSDWDGNDGWPMPELWDTHTLEVNFNGTSTNTDTTAVTIDCIAAAAYVEQQGGL